jgi:hypothetical protein
MFVGGQGLSRSEDRRQKSRFLVPFQGRSGSGQVFAIPQDAAVRCAFLGSLEA